ncbi:MAG: 2-dehydropantoate 2-reductase [Archaeoglobi archaeon]|nr:2-dehydropantoate 2-reductase [Candidatus Mnemosynella bozhongmuii]MDK2781542.1 2-dehydropantoate 2-reductase [Archaeoglobi archaeon]
MRISIMGAGALGSLIGALLHLSGVEVILIGRPPHITEIEKNGLRISGRMEALLRIPTSLHPVECDLSILTVKSYDTREAARQMKGFEFPVLSLQNGIGNEEILMEELGEERVIGGVTSYGALRVEPGHVKYTGEGEIVIGEMNGELTGRIRRISEVFRKANLNVRISRDVKMEIWKKAIVNCGINPLTAIAGVRNGALLEIPTLRKIMKEVCEEAKRIAESYGIRFDEDPVNKTFEVARKTSENLSSMLQDVMAGRRTEIDAINGEVVRRARALKIPAPINESLYRLVKVLENDGRTESSDDSNAPGA